MRNCTPLCGGGDYPSGCPRPFFIFYTSSHRMYLKETENPMKVEIKKDTKAHNKFAVKMEFTEGAILALANGLQKHANSGSAVAAGLCTGGW